MPRARANVIEIFIEAGVSVRRIVNQLVSELGKCVAGSIAAYIFGNDSG